MIEEASKERRGKNKIFAHIQKEIETKEHNKPKINENDMVIYLRGPAWEFVSNR